MQLFFAQFYIIALSNLTLIQRFLRIFNVEVYFWIPFWIRKKRAKISLYTVCALFFSILFACHETCHICIYPLLFSALMLEISMLNDEKRMLEQQARTVHDKYEARIRDLENSGEEMERHYVAQLDERKTEINDLRLQLENVEKQLKANRQFLEVCANHVYVGGIGVVYERGPVFGWGMLCGVKVLSTEFEQHFPCCFVERVLLNALPYN